MKPFHLILLLFTCTVFSSQVEQSLPAFPGAEGFGAASVGGRGGEIIKVTTLQATGPGSLQAALDVNKTRTIVFEVSGVIYCDRPLILRYPYVTIAGQTAPGAGITIDGTLSSWGYDVHDVIIRFLRFRLRRPEAGRYSQGDCIQLGGSSRGILDHVSLAWGTDEVVDLYEADNWTMQWCTIEESDPVDGHNFGFIARSRGSGNITIHHNLFAHHFRRAPCLSPDSMDTPGDIRNNVIYNVQQCIVHDGARTGILNIVGNYFKYGPSFPRIFPIAAFDDGTYFIEGNYIAHMDPNQDYGYFGNLSGGENFPRYIQYNYLGTKLKTPAAVPRVRTETALEAFESVLAKAGAFPRDRITLRTIKETRTGTGNADRKGPPTDPEKPISSQWFLQGLEVKQPALDSDDDGMADRWEEGKGLDPFRKDHNTILQAGYTAIEIYLHELAEALIEGRDVLE
jgi:pectate lyase